MRLISALFFILLSLAMPTTMLAQTDDWRDYLQQLGEDGFSSEQLETMYEELTAIEASPFNLNALTMDDLHKLPFLSEDQRQSMMDFLEKNRPVYSVYELRNIPLLDIGTVQMIMPFLTIGEYAEKNKKRSLADIFKYGKNEIQLRFDKVYPQRAGYKTVSDSTLQRYPNRIYRGEDFFQSVKYAYTSGRQFQAGLVAEKDAGEPFFRKEHKGYDHYGAYIALKDMGKLKSFVLGDFRLSFGQGLILNNNFSLGKTALTTAVIKQTSLPTRHASTAESGYFRGIASAFSFGQFSLTAFYSARNVDANLSSGDSIFTSFKTDGYHRTLTERSKKGDLSEQAAGANIQYRKNRFQIGASILYYQYDKPFMPTFQEYNRFNFRGKTNLNGSIDYTYRFRRFSIAGETAISENGSFATINALNLYPKQGVSVSILQRQFSRSYQAEYANTFSDGSGARNESGWYVGSQFAPSAKLSVAMYADIASFPWLKYGIDAPSHSYDYLVKTNYKHSNSLSLDIRYRFRQREHNEKYPDSKTTSVLPNNQHKILIQIHKTFTSRWTTRTILDGNLYKVNHFSTEKGWMASQIVSWQHPKRWKSDFFIGYFNSDSYDVRVYSRERNINNGFYMPSFYGKGLRSALSANCDIIRNITLAIKCGITKYFDRDTVGSDLEEIDASHRLDVMSYLRWKF